MHSCLKLGTWFEFLPKKRAKDAKTCFSKVEANNSFLWSNTVEVIVCIEGPWGLIDKSSVILCENRAKEEEL